jgi:hypothetical protein
LLCKLNQQPSSSPLPALPCRHRSAPGGR